MVNRLGSGLVQSFFLVNGVRLRAEVGCVLSEPLTGFVFSAQQCDKKCAEAYFGLCWLFGFQTHLVGVLIDAERLLVERQRAKWCVINQPVVFRDCGCLNHNAPLLTPPPALRQVFLCGVPIRISIDFIKKLDILRAYFENSTT